MSLGYPNSVLIFLIGSGLRDIEMRGTLDSLVSGKYQYVMWDEFVEQSAGCSIPSYSLVTCLSLMEHWRDTISDSRCYDNLGLRRYQKEAFLFLQISLSSLNTIPFQDYIGVLYVGSSIKGSLKGHESNLIGKNLKMSI
ncbi:hypothetical protein M5689_006330 [Euphorbia peplus]|nr:hypothetical protein M5689_006330 [Euphorbia peplus]